MKRIPRILPLVAVAAGGVLALKAFSGIEGAPKVLETAKAWAEEVQKGKGAKADKAAAKADKAAAEGADQSKPVAAVLPGDSKPTPIIAGTCAPSAAELAREAGLSPAELQVLQSLTTRRGQLDQREKDMDTQIQLLTAAEAKLDAKLQALEGLKTDIAALIGQADQKEAAEITRLVTVYSKMKPRDAANIMTTLDDKVRIPVAAKMKEATLAAVMSAMPTPEAKKLTESLANRYSAAQTLAAAAQAPDPAAAAAAAKAAADPKAAAKPAAPAKAAAAKPAAAPPKAG